MTSGLGGPAVVHVDRAGVRLDRLLADALDLGRRQARQWIARGLVLVDGRRVPASFTPRAGARIVVAAPSESTSPTAWTSGLERPTPRVILHRDELVVLNKPAGVHAHEGLHTASAASFMRAAFPESTAAGLRAEEGGIAHRLDRDTSGVLLATLSRLAYRRVRTWFSEGKTRKTYLALVVGAFAHPLVVDQPLARRRTRVVPARRGDRGLPARTHIEALEVHRSWSLVSVQISTGVTHQVRAHLALAGHAILGDDKYGGAPAPPCTRQGQLLHAMRLEMPGLDVSAAIAVDFVAAYAALRAESDAPGAS